MALKPKIREEEIWLYLILTNPQLSAEFFFIDEKNEAFKLWDYQFSLFDWTAPKELLFCARKVSKTTTIVARLFSFPFRKPGRRAFLTAAESFHLETVTAELEKQIRNSYIHRNYMKIRFRPYFTAKAASNSLIFARVPQKKGKGVKSIHADEVYADEYQDFTDKAKAELNEVFQAGGNRLLAGVPDGSSLKLSQMIAGDSAYKIIRIPRMFTPLWNSALRREKIEEYGSEENPDYRRNILGEFPEEFEAVFPKRVVYTLIKDDELFNKKFIYEKLSANYATEEHISITNPFKDDFEEYYFGMDLGWGSVAPSVISVLAHTRKEPGIYYLIRVTILFGFKPQQLQEIYKRLTNLYKPKFVGVDASGGGAILADLLNKTYPTIDIDVTKKVQIPFGQSGKKDVYVNDLTVELLRDLVLEERLIIPKNEYVFKDLVQFKQKEGQRKIYSKNCHIVDSLRCFVGADFFASKIKGKTFEIKPKAYTF